MFGRPRCRDWSPLSTQQLRLRSLVQISGHNIVSSPAEPSPPSSSSLPLGRSKCTVYFTLHQTPMSAPFYTSEKLDLHRNVLWADIDCPAAAKSSLRSVCVRVWEQTPPPSASAVPRTVCDNKCTQQGESTDGVVPGEAPESAPSDRVLFVWGVYFSGLVPLSRRSEKRLKPNTLVFQMHGGYFTSADCIVEPDEAPRPPHTGLSETGIPKTPNNLSPAPGGGSSGAISIPASGRSRIDSSSGPHCDSSNNSPVPAQPSPSSATHHWYFANSVQQQQKFSVSPDTRPTRPVSTSVSPTPTEPPETSLRLRYLHMEFPAGEVRTSYDLVRLLAVQERQRRLRYEADSAKTLTERICMKSAYCLNLELFSNKHAIVYRSASNRAGMGKQLSRLLYQDREPIDPTMLLRGQALRRHIERARFQCRLLAEERERARAVMQQLRYKLHLLSDGNIERESALMERYRTYGREKEQLSQRRAAYDRQRDTLRKLKGQVLAIRQSLLHSLGEIYYIRKTSQGMYTINDVPLPNAESYTDSTPALALSVALGFVAHAVMMCSSFLDSPLRNPIQYDGSRSKVMDIVKALPTVDREFPLHCRSGPAPNSVLYGVYLLNQNISQFKFQLGMSRGDPRATLVNLHSILTVRNMDRGGSVTVDGTLTHEIQQSCPIPTTSSGSFGASSLDLKMSPAFHSLSLGGGGGGGGGSSSGTSSTSSGSYRHDNPSSSGRISSSVDDYTERERIQRLHQMMMLHPVHQQPAAAQCPAEGIVSPGEQRLGGCGSRFSSDPILTKAQRPRPLDFEGGKKF
ncbi:UV radiation resistance-associated gene protein [Anopheles cruzii]|uniref:UV radiation resistance-associated gene protein n=1 Tax=Anopheles cruzii TaxID=68878 RepID=UPI0022EC184F|nr:UV radiation resistance-associated gene protein [Anopheles cruzii]